MKRMTVECACERGGDCTRTTVCAIDSALQDQADEYERQLELYEQYMVRAAKVLQHRLSGHDNNNLAAEIYMVLDGINPEDGP
jgi:hypothetical protein